MDFNHNGKDPSQFIGKAKKQAKRLLQLSKKTNNNLNVESLSAAQEILAKINGFPDWHAMNNYAFKDVALSKEEKVAENKIDTPIIKNDFIKHYNLGNSNSVNDILYYENDSGFQTVFELSLSNEFNEILLMWNALLDELDFLFNLNYNSISFSFIQNDCSDNCLDSEKRTKASLLIYLDTSRKAYKVYTGSISIKDNHLNFCKRFVNLINGFKLKTMVKSLEYTPEYVPQNFQPIYFYDDRLKSHFHTESQSNYELVKRTVFLFNYIISEEIKIMIDFDFKRIKMISFEKESEYRNLLSAFLATKRFPEKSLVI